MTVQCSNHAYRMKCCVVNELSGGMSVTDQLHRSDVVVGVKIMPATSSSTKQPCTICTVQTWRRR